VTTSISTRRIATIGRRAMIAGAAAAGSLAATAGRARADAKIGIPNIIKPGTLVMSINPTLPPLQYVNDKGEVQGMRVELGNAMAKWMGLTPEYVKVDFSTMVPGLAAKRWDMINTGIYWTEERSKLMYMVPYELSAIGFIVPPGNPLKISKWQDLAGRTVSTELGGLEERSARAVDDMLKKAGLAGITIQTFNNFAEAFQALRAGQVDASVSNDATSMYLQQRGEFSRGVVGMFPQVVAFAFADKTLADLACASLDDLRKTGYYDALFDRYGILKNPPGPFTIKGPGPT
jgi:polar amino acid transport system substrate-binding protein